MNEAGEVAEGYWCEGCEFFEDGEIQEVEGRCVACGCRVDQHQAARVLAPWDKES